MFYVVRTVPKTWHKGSLFLHARVTTRLLSYYWTTTTNHAPFFLATRCSRAWTTVEYRDNEERKQRRVKFLAAQVSLSLSVKVFVKKVKLEQGASHTRTFEEICVMAEGKISWPASSIAPRERNKLIKNVFHGRSPPSLEKATSLESNPIFQREERKSRGEKKSLSHGRKFFYRY